MEGAFWAGPTLLRGKQLQSERGKDESYPLIREDKHEKNKQTIVLYAKGESSASAVSCEIWRQIWGMEETAKQNSKRATWSPFPAFQAIHLFSPIEVLILTFTLSDSFSNSAVFLTLHQPFPNRGRKRTMASSTL